MGYWTLGDILKLALRLLDRSRSLILTRFVHGPLRVQPRPRPAVSTRPNRALELTATACSNKRDPDVQKRVPSETISKMKSKYFSRYGLVLILAVMYAVSIGTADARSTGRLIVSRDPNLGWNSVVNLRIDGRSVANIGRGSQFNRSVWTGRRVLSVSAWPSGSRSSSTVLNVRRGQTYRFTAARRWWGSNSVVLVPQGRF